MACVAPLTIVSDHRAPEQADLPPQQADGGAPQLYVVASAGLGTAAGLSPPKAQPVEASQDGSELFTNTERLAIHLGLRDPLPCPGSQRGLSKIFHRLFGTAGPRPLADPRLESLRLLVLSLRRSDDIDRVIAATADAGVPLVQIQALLARLAAHGAAGGIDG